MRSEVLKKRSRVEFAAIQFPSVRWKTFRMNDIEEQKTGSRGFYNHNWTTTSVSL